MRDERVFLGLGSNLGRREENVRSALNRVADLAGTELVRVSRLIETSPWGVPEQPDFINAAAEIRTELEPEPLLAALKEIERDLGRVPSYRWGPRVIDIDLLLYGERRIRAPDLTLPHPGVADRPFVREPLEEIAPEVLARISSGEKP